MNQISQDEIARQFDVLKQSIEMHTQLRSRYKFFARVSEYVLLTTSVFFAITTFGANEFFTSLSINNDLGDKVLKFASVVAFLASLLLLIQNWNGKAANHDDAAKRLFPVLKKFREAWRGDIWDESCLDDISAFYWQTSDNIEPIPANKFNKLKSKYLLKKEISILLEKHPGCPRLLLWFCIILRDTYYALRHFEWKSKD